MVDDQIINSTSLPVIDLREFEDDSCSAKAYKKLRETCEVWGCFRMINHTIPLELMSEMKAVVQSLLDLPAEIKNQNTNNTIGRGYVAPSAGMPLYEALGLYDFGSTKAVRSFCDQLDASPHQSDGARTSL
ncbi:Non-heme dioxygenase N-terminal domain containing protein [Trema orientale]|uniref:Non-heme dioxygenase N-terminal domain containing protein n=1 Tax=Trema orientale TaxID=63057 RepID=A0A2P5E9Q3_TREOI|nr:Non-heme dioxygenase N-terminal domain containing protein [Trema orientale]